MAAGSDVDPPAHVGPGAARGDELAIDHAGTRADLAFRRRHHLRLGVGSLGAIAGGLGLFLGLFRSHGWWQQLLAFAGLALVIAGVIVLATVGAGVWATYRLRRALAAGPWRDLPQHQVVRVVLGTEGSSPLAIAFDDAHQPHEPDPPPAPGVPPRYSGQIAVRRVVSVQASKRRMRAVQDGDVLLTRVAGPHGPWWALARSGNRWLVLAKEPSRFDHRMFRRRAPQLYDPTP